MVEEDETSFNFGGQLTFSETDILDFPRMFAKMGGKKWKASKDECTLLIKLLLEYYSLHPSIYYMNYPDEEMEDSSSDSSDSSQEEDEDEYEGNSDLDGHLRLSDDWSECLG